MPLLLPVLADDDEPLRVRVTIANVLGTLGVKDSRVFQELANVLLDDNEAEPLRVATAKSIRGSQAGDAILLLRKVKDDRSKAVRKVAEEAIRRFESARKDSVTCAHLAVWLRVMTSRDLKRRSQQLHGGPKNTTLELNRFAVGG